MKIFRTILAFVVILSSLQAFAQTDAAPWKPEQLMPPAALATMIQTAGQSMPLLINVGPAGVIKGAIDIGPAREAGNLKKLQELLSKEKKDRAIVVYCGCCPSKNCPNIRPTLALLQEMKFTNMKLLDLPHNLKVDWINVGYPMAAP